ncbi:MAG: hypothetical protein IPF68_13525 [Bacteroidales bacterium]|nr:hypothetical protein [Bacteroidales bacterium]
MQYFKTIVVNLNVKKKLCGFASLRDITPAGFYTPLFPIAIGIGHLPFEKGRIFIAGCESSGTSLFSF